MIKKRNFSIFFLFSLLLSVSIQVHATIVEHGCSNTVPDTIVIENCEQPNKADEGDKKSKQPIPTKYLTLNSDYLPILKVVDWNFSQVTPSYYRDVRRILKDFECQIPLVGILGHKLSKEYLAINICPNAP